MKIFHTADWHLGKLVQGVYMTEDQRFILDRFIEAIDEEKPDVIIIAGDLYDRAVPPTEAVELLDEVLAAIVLKRNIPVVAIAGNHDSPSRLHFASKILKDNGLHLVGQLSTEMEPVILNDQFGEVHFHLVPFCDPSVIRSIFDDSTIKNHNQAALKITEKIKENISENVRNVMVGHLFATPHGEEKENTSDSERPLAIGGAEHVDARLFEGFHYTALGHLHQAHHLGIEKIRYAGSPLKYSISEEKHNKGFLIVNLNEKGEVDVERRLLEPKHDLRVVEATIEEIQNHDPSEDYVFIRLLNEHTVLYPMEKVRAIYPNALHVERKPINRLDTSNNDVTKRRDQMNHLELFRSFYKEVNQAEAPADSEKLIEEVLHDVLHEEQYK
ncbi:exonuclease SbcCD subunit D [Halalkalibacillus halophilus]|uniref:exonuclease SbcCD subunit D n=1 Tax=Halalkalibacillus halophilus TaxID=392827 RepID=UPI0003FDF450|nr:exonuclease SbcCD subunit D [Halalkalibacillus halophilus]